jgi:hypothetical protein
MDADNNGPSGGANQRQPSAEHRPQGASASQAGGDSSQGNLSPTLTQFSNISSTASVTAPDIISHSQNSKRRRGLGVVTPNACKECRKKRAKVYSRSTPSTMHLKVLDLGGLQSYPLLCTYAPWLFCYESWLLARDGFSHATSYYIIVISLCLQLQYRPFTDKLLYDSATAKNHADVVKHKRMLNVFMRFSCAGQKRICGPKLRASAKSNALATKSLQRSSDQSYGKKF